MNKPIKGHGLLYKPLAVLSFLLLPCLVMTGCGGSGTAAGGNTSQVTISLGQGVLAGALTAPGTIPAGVQSFSVTARNSAGQIIAGPVTATLPQTSVTLTVPNGSGITFDLHAYDAANGLGKVIYQGTSAPQTLNGTAVAIPMQLNLAVTITANTLQTSPGGSITLNGFVAGATPPATSPLLWSATGGTWTTTANGALAVWTAPTTAVGQTYTISAQVDPVKNPQQNPGVVGRVNVLVVPQVNNYGFAMSGNSFTVNGLPGTVDIYGNATNAIGTAGVAMNISFGFRDYTGTGATTYNPAFSFDIRENIPGLRKAIGVITPVTVTTTANGQVSVNVPANATLRYTATSAAGTTVLNQTSVNTLANVITTSQAGVVTLDINALLRTIAGRSTPAMNIFSAPGLFSYEIGLAGIDMGHENATATSIDRLFDVGLNTSTKGVKGNITIQ